MISWDITNKCNMNCRHCLNRSNDANTHSFEDEFNCDEFDNIINQIIEAKPYTLCICGGEPTLSPYLFTIIDRISKSGILVNMVSNGYLINREFSIKLKTAGLNFIQISIDGDNAETHDNFRCKKGAFDNAINAIKYLVEQKFQVAASFCPNKTNIMQFNNFVDMMMKIGCKHIRMMPILPMGRGYEEFSQLEPSEEEYLYLKRSIINCKTKYASKNLRIDWGDPLEHIYIATQLPRSEPITFEIRSNGDIGPSIYLPISAGNVKKHSILEYWEAGFNRIWGNPEVLKLAQKIQTLEDFKDLSLRTWNIERKYLDLMEV